MKPLLTFRRPLTRKKYQPIRGQGPSHRDDTYRLVVDLRRPWRFTDAWLTKKTAAIDSSIIEVFVKLNREDDPEIAEYVCEQEKDGKTFRYVTSPKYATILRETILKNYSEYLVKDPA